MAIPFPQQAPLQPAPAPSLPLPQRTPYTTNWFARGLMRAAGRDPDDPLGRTIAQRELDLREQDLLMRQSDQSFEQGPYFGLQRFEAQTQRMNAETNVRSLGSQIRIEDAKLKQKQEEMDTLRDLMKQKEVAMGDLAKTLGPLFDADFGEALSAFTPQEPMLANPGVQGSLREMAFGEYLKAIELGSDHDEAMSLIERGLATKIEARRQRSQEAAPVLSPAAPSAPMSRLGGGRPLESGQLAQLRSYLGTFSATGQQGVRERLARYGVQNADDLPRLSFERAERLLRDLSGQAQPRMGFIEALLSQPPPTSFQGLR